jgi:hypothetical protein
MIILKPLILALKPAVDKEALVSREKVTEFKNWLENNFRTTAA